MQHVKTGRFGINLIRGARSVSQSSDRGWGLHQDELGTWRCTTADISVNNLSNVHL